MLEVTEASHHRNNYCFVIAINMEAVLQHRNDFNSGSMGIVMTETVSDYYVNDVNSSGDMRMGMLMAVYCRNNGRGGDAGATVMVAKAALV